MGAALQDLLNNDTSAFRGGIVGKKPERFTQETLIDGVLSALGYETTHDPVELLKDEPKQPDVKLDGLSDPYVGVVECKALNRERNSEDALDSLEERYLKTNAFAHYKKDLNMRYLVGIATDGFDWKLRVKDLETGEMRPDLAVDYCIADNSKGLHHCYYSEIHEETKTNWPEIRENLAENFVSSFARHNLPGHASD